MIQAYLQLKNLQFQELVMQQIMYLCKGIIGYLKKWDAKNMENPERKEGNNNSKPAPNSLIYWIINFTPQQKFQNKHDLIITPLNSHTILELVTKVMSRTASIVVYEESLSFVQTLF
jgi:hypothetical protein